MLTYEEAIKKVDTRLRFGVKPGLERISMLLEKLGNPQNSLKFVHVAGTNGKGTTCTLISSALTKAGYKTGLYTSPYVLEFRERFMINGQMIPKAELAEVIETVSEVIEKLEAEGETFTEFEFITAMAMLWFAKSSCDVVVLEVGLGGRFDATNVISTPELAVIMSISLDHTHILGEDIRGIAAEKAGIIKGNGDVLLYPIQQTEVTDEITKVCKERSATLKVPSLDCIKVLNEGIDGTKFEYEGVRLKTPFLGKHQVYNAVMAYSALTALREKGYNISDEAIKDGFVSAFIPARMEIISHSPLVILDGGHNPGCAAALADVIEEKLADKRIVGIFGMMADKDSNEAFSILGGYFSKMITVAPNQPRSLGAEELAKRARRFCPDVHAAKSINEALELALDGLSEENCLIVGGSFFLASEMRDKLMGSFGGKA